VSDRTRRLTELALVVASAAVFAALPKPPDATLPLAVFIPSCVLSWGAYGVWRLRHDRTLATTWGLRPRAHLGPLLRVLLPLFTVSVAGGAAWATAQGRPLLAPALGVSLLLYPLWGLIQQWIVQVLVVDNVAALTGARLPWLVGLGAVGFGVIHFQHPALMASTAVMGGAYVVLFQRWRNLWPLAVCHGWLGSLFYPWVLALNPTADLVALISGP